MINIPKYIFENFKFEGLMFSKKNCKELLSHFEMVKTKSVCGLSLIPNGIKIIESPMLADNTIGITNEKGEITDLFIVYKNKMAHLKPPKGWHNFKIQKEVTNDRL